MNEGVTSAFAVPARGEQALARHKAGGEACPRLRLPPSELCPLGPLAVAVETGGASPTISPSDGGPLTADLGALAGELRHRAPVRLPSRLDDDAAEVRLAREAPHAGDKAGLDVERGFKPLAGVGVHRLEPPDGFREAVREREGASVLVHGPPYAFAADSIGVTGAVRAGRAADRARPVGAGVRLEERERAHGDDGEGRGYTFAESCHPRRELTLDVLIEENGVPVGVNRHEVRRPRRCLVGLRDEFDPLLLQPALELTNVGEVL